MKKFVLICFLAFCALTATAATFTSNVVSGDWSVAGSWTVVGADADGIPDNGDDVTINAGNTIRLMGISVCRNLTVSAGATLNYNNKTLQIHGNFTRTGNTTASGLFYFFSATGTITITGTYNNGGNWNFMNGSNYSIAAGAVIIKTNYFYVNSGAHLTNNSDVNLLGGSVSAQGTATFTNGATGSIAVAYPFLGPITNFNFSTVGNLVRYSTINTPTIINRPYYNLDLINTSGTKTWSGGALTVAGNLRIFSGCTLNCASQNINLGGNWVNFSTITPTNQATINFTGSGTQTISRTTGTMETFNSVDLNGTGTVLLADSITINGSLNINSGTLDVAAANYNIHIKGNFVNSSTFNARNGTVFFDGTVGQNMDGISTTTYYNVTASTPGGVTVNSTKQLSNLLKVSNGTFSTSAFGGEFILLASGPTNYARIAPITTGGLGGSGWVIQAYVNGPATAYWQFITSPVSGNTLNDWDADTRFYMSGVGGNEGNACCPIFRSVRTYNEPTNTYSNITSVGTALSNGGGYMVWMADNLNSLTGPLVYDSRGTATFGTVNRAVTAGGAGGGYNLVGNPFACPIDFATVRTSSSASLNANFLVLQENGSYATSPNGGVIGPNQAFMVVATTGGNMTVTEACKNIVTMPNFIREAAPENTIRIKAGNEASGIGEQATVQIADGAFNEFVNTEDLPYLESPYEYATRVWTNSSDATKTLYNVVGSTDAHLMIPVTVVAGNPGKQILQFKGLTSVTAYNCAWLEDLTTGQRISLNQIDTYSYDEPTIGASRNFILHLERTADCTFNLQNSTASLEASTNVYMNGGNVYAQFEFDAEEQVAVSMFDITGREVMGERYLTVSNETVQLDTPEAHGIYMVRIVKGNEVTTKKFYY